MSVIEIPLELQCGAVCYPSHSDDLGLEAEIHQVIARSCVPDGWTYLPVYWTNNYHFYGFKPCEAAQTLLDGLDPARKYFTVVQCDDGIYEDVPANVLVFGAGGVGDVPIPLLCKRHLSGVERKRKLLASFIGQIECGGPEFAPGTAKRSSWDADGAGAATRRAMQQYLGGKPGIVIEQGGPGKRDRFRWLMERSVFALCPRGYGRTSFRLYEAMDFGAVPVYIYDDPWLPYSELDWSKLAICCPVGQLKNLYSWLCDSLGSAESMREAAQRHRDIFTYQGIGEWMIDYLKSAVCMV